MTSSNARIIPSLYLSGMKDSVLLDYAQRRVTDVTANVAFTTVFPKTATVKLSVEDFANALQAFRPGDKATTKAKNIARAELEVMLTDYAGGCAAIAGTDAALFLTTGFSIKRAATPTTSINTPASFEVMPGSSGTLLIKRFAVPRGRAYDLYVGTSPDTMKYHSTQSGRRLFIADLVPGTLYYISMRAVGPRGLVSAMSQVMSQRSM